MAVYNDTTMSKYQMLILLGLWVMAFLFLGFPFFLDKIIAVIIGLSIILLAHSARKGAHKAHKVDMDTSGPQVPYVEHRNVSSKVSRNSTVSVE